MADETDDFEALLETLRRAAGILLEANVPFLLAGGLAAWARGGPRTEHDVDLLVRPRDAKRALEALAAAGMRTERPPEGWLFKAYDDGRLVDLIFEPHPGEVDDGYFERADELEVVALRLHVAALEDVLVSKLLALSEQEPDFSGVLEIARSVREQIDWQDVRASTEGSPFAQAFFTLAEELEIVEPTRR